MALGGNVLRQHVVEFIRGTGVVTDGVVDATSLNGPWSWQVPDGVAELTLDGCGGGGGGAGGQSTGAARGGGGGGGSGLSVNGFRVPVIPGAVLSVTVGAGGTGGPAGASEALQAGTQGGNTIISGVVRSPISPLGGPPLTLDRVVIPRGGNGGGNNTPGNGGGGGTAAGAPGSMGIAQGGSGATAAASPAAGSIGTEISPGNIAHIGLFGCSVFAHGGSGAGAGSTTPTTAGSGGAGWRSTGGRTLSSGWNFQSVASTGSTDGSVSYGGGGGGGPSSYGLPGDPGNGNQSAAAGTGFGYGGSGGGGNGAGAAGGDGYLRFTYWSMD